MRCRLNFVSRFQEKFSQSESITAAAADKEAVCYQGEIASVLENIGCEVEIDNTRGKTSVQEIPKGVEMTIKEATVHASRIVRAFSARRSSNRNKNKCEAAEERHSLHHGRPE